MEPQPPKILVSVMRIYFNHPILIDDKIVTYRDFETWEPNEGNLEITSYEIGIKVTWEGEDTKERRIIPWENIAILEMKDLKNVE